MARAANASVYSPELLSSKYGSRPVKVNYIHSFTSDVTLIASPVCPYHHPFVSTFVSDFPASPSCRFCGGLLKFLLGSVHLGSRYGWTS